MCKRALLAAALLLLPTLTQAQQWSTISVVTDANDAQQLILRSADGSAPRRIAVSNLLPDNPITGASLSGSVLTFTFDDGTTHAVALPAGGGGGSSDGVISGASFAADGSTLTITRTVGGDISVSVPASLRTAAIGANSVTAAQARANTEAQRREWQTRLGVPDDWSDIPANTPLALGKIVEHNGAYFGALTAHNRSGTGPDGDSTNWILLSNWAGTWTDDWYPQGSFVSRSGLPWVASQNVARGDPAPDAGTNTKWLQLGSAAPTVTSFTTNTIIPAAGNGNSYVATGSTDTRLSLPNASGTGEVANAWAVVAANRGSGTVTVAPNGSDTINGSSTLTLAGGRAVRLQKVASGVWISVADTKDEVGTGGGGGTLADNSITPAKAQADTAVRMAAWRARLGSSSIRQVSAALPAVTSYNAGDLLIVGRGGTTTVTFVEVDAPATQLTSTAAGDLMMVLSNRWTRLGNLFSGGIAAAAARAIADANQAKVDRLTVFETARLSPGGIPDNTLPEFVALELAGKVDPRRIIEVKVFFPSGISAYTLNSGDLLAALNEPRVVDNKSVGPGGILNIAFGSAARNNFSTDFGTAAQFLRVDIHYKFEGTSVAANVPPDARDYIHFGTNNNAFRAPGGGLNQSQVDARVLALRSLVPTSATPAVGDRIFFTDEDQNGDPLRYTQVRTLATAINRTYTAKTATAGASRTWTYTLATEDTELWIGGVLRSTRPTLFGNDFPRGVFTSTARHVALDSRNPDGQNYPDSMSAGVVATLSGNTLTLVTTGWANIGTPIVYSK